MNQERKVVPILAPSARVARLTKVLHICDRVMSISLVVGAICAAALAVMHFIQ